MLLQLHIRNLIIVDELKIDFSPGMTALTGETGAGKSLLIDALHLGLGLRASSKLVGNFGDRAEVSALFDLAKSQSVWHWLHSRELIETGEYHCTLRRTIANDGRSRAYINGYPVSIQLLRELGGLLVYLHGQHEHLSILKPETQLLIIDSFGGHYPLLHAVQNIYSEWLKVQLALNQAQAATGNNRQRLSLLEFQLQELDQAQIKAREWEELNQQYQSLARQEELVELASYGLNLLDSAENDQGGIAAQLERFLKSLSNLQRFAPKLANSYELLRNSHILLTEASLDLRSFIESCETDPQKLTQIDERLELIRNLARKYKIEPHLLHELPAQLQAEFDSLNGLGEKIAHLSNKLTQLRFTYQEAAVALTQARSKAAENFATLVNQNLKILGLPEGCLRIKLRSLATDELHSQGAEKICFEACTNPGAEFSSLSEVVSGGELARIALAIQIVMSDREGTPSLVFDEVDVGIGGATAEVVGSLLHAISDHTQILCVTHQPQVAAQADWHLKINKSRVEGRAVTAIQILSDQERIQEIARMLGGVKITSQTLAHATEMLENAHGE